MAEEVDPYEVAFKGLKERGEQARPFQTLIRTKYKIKITRIQYWEDLVTGEKKQTTTEVHMIEDRDVPWTPFLTKTRRGPYFLNPISDMIEHFRKEQ